MGGGGCSAHLVCQKWRNSPGQRLFPERTLLNHVQPFIITRGLEANLSLHPLGAWFLELQKEASFLFSGLWGRRQ